MINTTQSRDKIYISLTIYIMGESNQKWELRESKTERTREIEKFLSCLEVHIIGNEKLFYRLFKWSPLMFSLMNINGTHK